MARGKQRNEVSNMTVSSRGWGIAGGGGKLEHGVSTDRVQAEVGSLRHAGSMSIR